jgi:hypothetical protein
MKAEGTEENDARTEKNNKKITKYKKKVWRKRKNVFRKLVGEVCVNWVAEVEQTRPAKEGNETELLGRLIKNVAGLCFLFRVRSALTGTP